MTQFARPTSLTTDEWTGTAAALADADDGTYLASHVSPVEAQTFLCALTEATDPGVDTGHQIRVRVHAYPSLAASHDLILSLENGDDSSVVATRTYTPVPDALADEVFVLTEAEVADIHDHASLQIRGYAKATTGTPIAFLWSAVTNATSYVLQVGTSSTLSDVCDSDVGNVLTSTLTLQSGNYWSRVVAYQNTTPLSTSSEQMVSVP